MGYAKALEVAWDKFKANPCRKYSTTFLGEVCEVDSEKEAVRAGNKKAKDFLAILLLHYLAAESAIKLQNEWISFKEFEGGDSYYPAFRERVIKPLIDKFGNDPNKLVKIGERFGGHKIEYGDAGIALNIFDNLPMIFIVWGGDDEFNPEANVLFDAGIKGVFSTEDVAVLAGVVVSKLIGG